MKIDFGKVITNALSVLVSAVFIGAAAIVWTGATTVNDKVNESKVELKSAIEVLTGRIAILEEDMYRRHPTREEPIEVDVRQQNIMEDIRYKANSLKRKGE